ncbi:MAG TPA: hypothetical protein VEU74_12160 [Gemmatimonadales bacterium]|nr:hypothetical protein [Gemmatimonadales bacterium]
MRALFGSLGTAGLLLGILAESASGLSNETAVGSLLVALIGFLILRSFTIERRMDLKFAEALKELGAFRERVAHVEGALTQVDARLDTQEHRTSEAYRLMGAEQETDRQTRHDLRNELMEHVGEAELRLTATVNKLDERVTRNEEMLLNRRKGDR